VDSGGALRACAAAALSRDLGICGRLHELASAPLRSAISRCSAGAAASNRSQLHDAGCFSPAISAEHQSSLLGHTLRVISGDGAVMLCCAGVAPRRGYLSRTLASTISRYSIMVAQFLASAVIPLQTGTPSPWRFVPVRTVRDRAPGEGDHLRWQLDQGSSWRLPAAVDCLELFNDFAVCLRSMACPI